MQLVLDQGSVQVLLDAFVQTDPHKLPVFCINQPQAIGLAADYWKTPEGQRQVDERENALERMRIVLHHPDFDFTAEERGQLLRIPELGRIFLGHEQKTVANLPRLREILRQMAVTAPLAALEALQTVPGIGRNLATKLLAMHLPEKFVVINEPVQSALGRFGYELEMHNIVTSEAYERFLNDLKFFIEECEAVGLRPAAALDAFFYHFRDKDVVGQG